MPKKQGDVRREKIQFSLTAATVDWLHRRRGIDRRPMSEYVERGIALLKAQEAGSPSKKAC